MNNYKSIKLAIYSYLLKDEVIDNENVISAYTLYKALDSKFNYYKKRQNDIIKSFIDNKSYTYKINKATKDSICFLVNSLVLITSSNKLLFIPRVFISLIPLMDSVDKAVYSSFLAFNSLFILLILGLNIFVIRKIKKRKIKISTATIQELKKI